MVEHIVCFKLKPETTTDQADKLVAMLNGLKESIAAVVDLSVGHTFTHERAQGFHIGLVVRFHDRAGLETYGPHPTHVLVKEYVAQVCDSVLAVDYEF